MNRGTRKRRHGKLIDPKDVSKIFFTILKNFNNNFLFKLPKPNSPLIESEPFGPQVHSTNEETPDVTLNFKFI